MNVTVALTEKDEPRVISLGPGKDVGRFLMVVFNGCTIHLHGQGLEAAEAAEQFAGVLMEAASELRSAEQADTLAAIHEQARDDEQRSLRGFDPTEIAEKF